MQNLVIANNTVLIRWLITMHLVAVCLKHVRTHMKTHTKCFDKCKIAKVLIAPRHPCVH